MVEECVSLNDWDKHKFIQETTEFLSKVGNTNQDNLSVLMLAENIE